MTLQIKDALGVTYHMSANGAGTEQDPFIVTNRISDSPGTLETRTVVIDSGESLTPTAGAFTAAAANLATLSGFTAGKKRCRLTLHVDMTAIPHAQMVFATLNAGDDVTAAARLSLASMGPGDTGTADTRQRIASQTQPQIEWDLTGTESDVQRIDIIGVDIGGTNVSPAIVSVEVW